MSAPAKIPVAVLGATGSVGQRFVQLLADHPWFECRTLVASAHRAGARYGDVVEWDQAEPLPRQIADLTLREAGSALDVPLAFSALAGSVAGELETEYARAGVVVVSNAKSHRLDADVPLIVPEINAAHLDLLTAQPFERGAIVTNPNCSTIGLALALAPLQRAFAVASVHVVTLQAMSGAGRTNAGDLDLVDNVLPYIAGEEDKLEAETNKLFGTLQRDHIAPAGIALSAQCNRVAVVDGHTACASIKLERPATHEEIVSAWRSFRAEPQELGLPLAPERPLVYLADIDAPQPKHHRGLERGMATVLGRLQPCAVHDWRFVALSHNTLRGAAGGALLVAELMRARGLLDALSN